MARVRTRFTFLLALSVAAIFPPASFAYKADTTRWTPNRTVLMHLSLVRSGATLQTFASFNDSAADALSMWNRYLVHMKFDWALASPLPPADNDADNSVFFSTSVFGKAWGKNVLAITLISTRVSIRTETDVLFNSAYHWDSYNGPLQNGMEDFHRVALHEFGHVVGLEHPDQNGQIVAAIMNANVSDLDTLEQDDISGAQSIYNTGPAFLTTQPSSNLVNLSTRAFVGTGESVLIGGFIIQGSQPATVILRAIGHSLAARGVGSPLYDPQIELRDSNGSLLGQNDDWIDGADAQTIASYHLDPSNSTEAALLRTLNPGSYTAIVKAFDNGDGKVTGNALVEVFDLHTSSGRAGNIATRGQVLGGNDVMIAGFIIGGSDPKEVVVRGLGPSLTAAGVGNALSDPTIELRDSTGALIAGNDNWQTDANANRVSAVNLAPKRAEESALDLTLAPGTYTVIVRSANGGTGIGLVEVYDLSPAPN